MQQENLSIQDAVELGAVDSPLFCHYFFPKTVRQRTPDFHYQIWDLLESKNNRLNNIQVFRGGAKTSLLRMYTMKRICYGLAHTILYIGKSEGHAVRSVRWIKRQVEYNKLLSSTFGLSKGKKWQDTEIEIRHNVEERPIWILAMGITGSVRGINEDDYRPDLIIVDDAIDEENAATPEQRNKIENLLYGALKESLAPRSETPDAKLSMLQTPLNKEDASTKALKDPEWVSAKFGCWTERTKHLPLEQRQSIWEERWSSEELRKEKQAAIHRNKLSIFLREKECEITSPETSAFKAKWLKKYTLEPEGMTKVLVIDPVPPPSEIEIEKGLRGKDFEVIAVWGRHGNNFYLLEYEANRGHQPTWTVATYFELALRWLPRETVVEAVAYQRTLAWILKNAMEERGQYFTIVEMVDKRSKFNRIVDGLNGPASNGKIFVKDEHVEFIEQFESYPDVSHDDILETGAVAVAHLSKLGMGGDGDIEKVENEEDYPRLVYGRGAP